MIFLKNICVSAIFYFQVICFDIVKLWNSMELFVSAKLAYFEFHGIPWNCSCNRNWRIPSSMEFHKIFFCYLMEPLASSILWVLNLDIIPWNLSFQILMKIISTFAEWINFRKLISTLYRFVSLFHQLMLYYQYLHYTICFSGITHYVSTTCTSHVNKLKLWVLM